MLALLFAIIAPSMLLLVQWLLIQRAIALARASIGRAPNFERCPAAGQRGPRVLILGDSTAVGVGACGGAWSIAGLLGAEFADAEIVNTAVAGARVQDVRLEVERRGWGHQHFDLVLLHAGGNDALRGTPPRRLALQAARLLAALRDNASRTVWLGAANIGLAPAFLPPLSWWLSARMRRVHDVLQRTTARRGVPLVSFFRERADDPFSRAPRLWFADDGLHPSRAGYRHCYDVLRRSVPLHAWLRPQPSGERSVLAACGASHAVRPAGGSGGERAAGVASRGSAAVDQQPSHRRRRVA